MNWSQRLQSSGFIVLFEEAVVLLLQVLLELGVIEGELGQTRPQLLLRPFETHQHIQFGQPRMMINSIKGCLEMSDKHHDSFSIEFGDSFGERRISDEGVFAL